MTKGRNPFPGMNPFLERYWSDFHTRMVVYLCNALQPGLPAGLFARVEETLYVATDHDEEVETLRPDVFVTENWSDSSRVEESVLAACEPVRYHQDEPEELRYIEIIDVKDGERVVTVIELLSPTNKGSGSEEYRKKCRRCRDVGVNLVEIDLLCTGRHVLSVPRSKIPARRRTPYTVCVTGDEGGGFLVWHIGLLDRLPKIIIPLREDDPEVSLELQPLVDKVYEEAGYDAYMDYRRPLDPPLPPEALALVQDRVR